MVDEAHNLVDRARDMFSAELRKRQFLELRRFAKKTQPQIYKAAGKVNSWFLKARKRAAPDGAPWSETEPPGELAAPLAKFLRAAELYLVAHHQPGSGKAQAFRDKLIDLYFDAARFARVAEQFDGSYSTCYEPADKDIRVKLFCMDPSTQLSQALERCKTAVFFSATMTPSGYFRRIFGCKESAKELILPSPFPRENFRVLVTDTISTLYRQRNKTKHDVAQAIAQFVEQKKGNYLLFFPSYEYMGMICSLFEPGDDGVEILVQSPAMSEEERDRFVGRFKAENQHTLVGFAVMGGIFGEGIDLVGDRLTGAAIVGVGLPGISPERELIRKHFDRWRAGFEYAYLYPGINRVLQAAGRVIRSETDRGAVLLIDERFSRARYQSLFPPDWTPHRLKSNEKLREVLAEFWQPNPLTYKSPDKHNPPKSGD
jgi:DNA excision repair protein ERCC-2